MESTLAQSIVMDTLITDGLNAAIHLCQSLLERGVIGVSTFEHILAVIEA